MEIILIGAYLLFATFVLLIIAILLEKTEDMLDIVKSTDDYIIIADCRRCAHTPHEVSRI